MATYYIVATVTVFQQLFISLLCVCGWGVVEGATVCSIHLMVPSKITRSNHYFQNSHILIL